MKTINYLKSHGNFTIKYLDDNTKRLHTRRFNNVIYGSSFEQWPDEAQKLIDDKKLEFNNEVQLGS